MTPFYSQAEFWRQAPGCQVDEATPPGILQPFVAQITTITAEVDLIKHRVPDGCFTLNIALGPGQTPPRSYIYPPFPAWKWMQIREGVTVLEARFRWGRGRLFVGIEPQAVGSCGMPADTVLPGFWSDVMNSANDATQSGDQIQIFVSGLERIAPAKSLRPELAAAFNLLEYFTPDRRAKEIIAASCLSGSQLRRVMARDVGLPPTKLLRLARLWQAMYAAIRDPKPVWSAIAAQCGFFDSAHLVDEFHYFADTSPTQWLSNLRCTNLDKLKLGA